MCKCSTNNCSCNSAIVPKGPQGPPGTVPSGVYIPIAGTEPSYPVTGNIEIEEVANSGSTNFSIFRNTTYTINQYASVEFDTFGRVTLLSKSDGPEPVNKGLIRVFSNVAQAGVSMFAYNTSNQYHLFAMDYAANYFNVSSTIPNFEGLKYAADYSANYTDSSLITKKDAPSIESGSGVPSSTPSKIGDIYVDISTPQLYFSKGSTSSADWVAI